jgi:hypothetical protein
MDNYSTIVSNAFENDTRFHVNYYEDRFLCRIQGLDYVTDTARVECVELHGDGLRFDISLSLLEKYLRESE